MNNTNYKDKLEDLVSIIMPTYNCSDFIGISIESVRAQIYQNWELIIVDDCSSDKTAKIVNSFLLKDKRIKYFRLNINSGAAMARNKAIDLARGKYLAFLDSDDLWFPEKLNKQIIYMKKNNYDFSCTSYIEINEKGIPLNRTIKAKSIIDYNGLLKFCPGNSTVIYNAEKLGKNKIPNIRKRNDYVMWLQIIKKTKYLYGLDEPLGYYRLRTGSLSRNKINLVKYQWKVYKDIENLSIIKSCYLIFCKLINTILKLK